MKNICLLIAAIVVGSSTVQAAVVTATYTGTVASGYSVPDTFGTGSLLDGLDFSAIFTYDTAVGFDSSPDFEQVYGGTDLVGNPSHATSPLLSAVLKIGSVSVNFAVNFYGQATLFDNGTTTLAFHYAGRNPVTLLSTNAGLGFFENRLNDTGFLTDIVAAQEFAGDHQSNPVFGSVQGAFRLDDGSIGSFYVNHLSIAAVPLPASLPLMGLALAGLAALGSGGLRRGRRRTQ